METNGPTKAMSEAAQRLAEQLGVGSPETEVKTLEPNEQENQQPEAVNEQVADPEKQQEPAQQEKKPKKTRAKKQDQVDSGQGDMNQESPKMEVVKEESDEPRGLSDEEREFIASISDDDPDEESGEAGFIGEAPDTVELKKKYEELETKVKDYESILEDPLVSAFAEFIKSGNTDVNEFAKQVGALNFGELSMEDMYRMRAQEMGFEGEELEDAVFEQMDKFNSMTRLEKKDEENKLRSAYKSQSAERLKSFTERTANERNAEQQRVNKIIEAADTELDEVLNKMKGQRWKSLVIDESMANTIRETIPALAPLMGKFDQNQKLIGLDVKEGIEMAIWKLYGKQLLKSTYDIGRTSGFDEAMKDRIRPTPTPGAGGSPSVASKSQDESISEARKAAAQKNSGRRSLFDVLK
jgi:hypothetical protein